MPILSQAAIYQAIILAVMLAFSRTIFGGVR